MVDFVIDNESLIARILTDLYHELPAQLRPQSDLVEASTILFEVLEYLTHVKKTLSKLESEKRRSVMSRSSSTEISLESNDRSTLDKNRRIIRFITNDSSEPLKVSLPTGSRLTPLYSGGAPCIELNSKIYSGSSAAGPIILAPGAKIPVVKVLQTYQDFDSDPPSLMTAAKTCETTSSSVTPDVPKAGEVKEADGDPLKDSNLRIKYVNLLRRPTATNSASDTYPEPPEEDGQDLSSAFIAQVLAFLKPKLILNPDLMTDSNHSKCLTRILRGLERPELLKFLQIMNERDERVQASSSCVKLESNPSFLIQGQDYPSQLLLFALFRPSARGIKIKDTVIVSRKECSVSRCINPWHYERLDPAVIQLSSSSNPHTCLWRRSINAKQVTSICSICFQKPDSVVTDIKPDPDDAESEVRKSIEELEQEFCHSLDEVQEEMDSSDEVNIKPELFQCPKCQAFFNAEELHKHSCSHKSKAKTLYCCKLCGFCHSDPSIVKEQFRRCQLFGLEPNPEIQIHSNLEPSRPKRSRKSDSKARTMLCTSCNVTFASCAELILHSDLSQCKSFQCLLCHQFYSSVKSRDAHDCPSLTDSIIRVPEVEDTTIQCPDCNLNFYSHSVLAKHRDVKVVCSCCRKSLASGCLLLRHFCEPVNEKLKLKQH